MNLPHRFWNKVEPEPMSGCWLWTSACTNGYGSFTLDGRTQIAHRLSYKALVGPIPEGLDLDHLCRNRACVCPDHLEPVDNRTNVLRGNSPAAIAHRTGICRSGRHLIAGDNLLARPNGERHCRSCFNELQRIGRSRRKAAA